MDARCSIRLCVPPRLVARTNTRTCAAANRGRRQERVRIAKLLADEGATVSPELARYPADDRGGERDDD